MPATNCPNCGAPLGRSGKCEYCGTVVENGAAFRPVEFIAVRPSMRKVEMKAIVRLDPSLDEATQTKVVAERLRLDMTRKLAEQLEEAVKYTIRQDYDPVWCGPVVLARGELWVADSDPRY